PARYLSSIVRGQHSRRSAQRPQRAERHDDPGRNDHGFVRRPSAGHQQQQQGGGTRLRASRSATPREPAAPAGGTRSARGAETGEPLIARRSDQGNSKSSGPRSNDMNQQNVQPQFNPATRPTAVIGAGTLGSRIALMLASSGGEVRLYDPQPAQLEIAERFIDSELPRVVAARAGAVAGPVVFSKALEPAIAEAWMVVEAVPERLDLKKAICGDLDRLAPGDAILASNSSSYPSSQIIGRVTNASRVVSTHYYMPPEQIAVEVMSCGKTSDAVIADLMDRLPMYGLVPFQVKRERVGFIFNRIWAAVERESLEIVEEGVSTPAEVEHIFPVRLR